MLADSEDILTSNGSSTRYSNAPTSPTQRAAPSVTNGTAKNLTSLNGSTRAERALEPDLRPTGPYYGHDREEVTRILIQALSDMGYQTVAQSLSQDSGFQLESPTVAAFRASILTGSWGEAEELLSGAGATTTATADAGNLAHSLVLAPGADPDVMRFWIRQQKFLELLEQRDTSRALMVLRSELTPLYHDTQKLHFLSGLLMLQSSEDVKAKAEWDGAQGSSRAVLLSELSRCISPSVMLPEARLAILLQQFKQGQIDNCLFHTNADPPSLYSDHYCDRIDFPSEVALELKDLSLNRGGNPPLEAWQIKFSNNGMWLAGCGSGDDVIIWSAVDFRVQNTLGGHSSGVGNLSWSPDDRILVTCSQDKHARLFDGLTGSLLKKLERYEEAVTGCIWAADGQSFVLGTLDKNRSIRTFSRSGDLIHDWKKKHRVQDLCGSADGRWLVAVDDVGQVYVYNGITRQLEYEMSPAILPTSVSISEDSRHLLLNRKDGECQLIELHTRKRVQKFLGHTGGRFLIRSSFGGANEVFVVSGSEDGNVLIWHKNSGAAVERLHGHTPRCNSVAWNPSNPYMLASCGDDGIVKIWSNKAQSAVLREAKGSEAELET